jgi:hypothetical protein
MFSISFDVFYKLHLISCLGILTSSDFNPGCLPWLPAVAAWLVSFVPHPEASLRGLYPLCSH